VATQHLLLALLSAREGRSWLRRGTPLPVQELLSRHGITADLAEEKTKTGIVTPLTWVLDDDVIALNAQVAALAELLTEKGVFTRPELVSELDRHNGPLVPELFISPLIEALGRKGMLTPNEQREVETAAKRKESHDKASSHDAGKPP
jgi:hypothetical protein